MSARGLTLLETMVALVILGLAVVGFLELFAGALRNADNSRTWSEAVAYAVDRMERLKLDRQPATTAPAAPERLAGGFERRVERRPWGEGVVWVTVVVALPSGGRVALDRLVQSP